MAAVGNGTIIWLGSGRESASGRCREPARAHSQRRGLWRQQVEQRENDQRRCGQATGRGEQSKRGMSLFMGFAALPIKGVHFLPGDRPGAHPYNSLLFDW